MTEIPDIPDLRVSQNLTERQRRELKKQWLIQYDCWDFNIEAPAGLCYLWRDENHNFVYQYSGARSVRLAALS